MRGFTIRISARVVKNEYCEDGSSKDLEMIVEPKYLASDEQVPIEEFKMTVDMMLDTLIALSGDANLQIETE